MRKWATRESRLNYLRLPANTGTPAVARNIGVDAASGDWVAFLDDDDTWVPAKLERQLRYVDEADIIASDAYLPDGRKYLRLERNARDIPRTQLLRTNPVIVSSAIAKREMVVDVGGFPEERRLAGVADYCLWMKLADAGARFFIVSEPLVLYNNAGTDRLSRAVLRGQTALARHCVIRWVRRPADRAIATSAAFHVALATRVALRRLAGSPLLRSLREN